MNEATLQFVRQHAGDDVRLLALKGCDQTEVDLPWALDQIAGRRRAGTKLPSWAQTEGIIYPPHLSMEQCSSEQTALYKAQIAGTGESMADLTGGFGVDFAWMARGFRRAVYVEQQQHLCSIATNNFHHLNLQAEVVCAEGISYLQNCHQHFGLIYLDPARRDGHGGRTYGIADCTPNVLEVKDLLLERADRVLLKLSPMLDWRKAVNDIGSETVREVHIVSVGNECKELLLLLQHEKATDRSDCGNEKLRLVCANDSQVTEFQGDAPSVPTSLYHGEGLEGSYLYEPNASVMKGGCFGEVVQRFGVSKLDTNSHLFVSSQHQPDFPGRCFIIDATSTMNKRELKERLKNLRQANITVRNFPLSVQELRKRLKVGDGGDCYIFATTIARQGHQLLICRKIG